MCGGKGADGTEPARVERAQAERRGWDDTTWAMRREKEDEEEGMQTNQGGTMGRRGNVRMKEERDDWLFVCF